MGSFGAEAPQDDNVLVCHSEGPPKVGRRSPCLPVRQAKNPIHSSAG